MPARATDMNVWFWCIELLLLYIGPPQHVSVGNDASFLKLMVTAEALTR